MIRSLAFGKGAPAGKAAAAGASHGPSLAKCAMVAPSSARISASCLQEPAVLGGDSRKRKAHKLLAHKLCEKAVNLGTTSQSTRRKRLFSWIRRRTHQRFCLVNCPVLVVSTGPSPEQEVYVHVPFH